MERGAWEGLEEKVGKGLAKGWRRVGEGLAKGWRVSLHRPTLQFPRRPSEDRVCDSSSHISVWQPFRN